MSIPLVQNNEKDAINTSIIAIKRNIERINNLLGLSGSEEIDTSIFATKEELDALEQALQPVDEVTSGNMHSVTSNAVSEGLSGLCFPIIPILLAFSTTSSSSWQILKYIGGYYRTFFDNLPTINGKTKKLRLVLEILTQAQNGIYIGLQRQSDPSPIIKVDNLVVWGGAYNWGFGQLIKIPIDPSFLDSFTTIQYKSSIEGYQVSVGYVYAEVYYE